MTTNQSRGTADPVDVEYLHQEPGNAPLGIHMHLDAVDGIARDVIEGFKALPRRGVEVGGLLLGKVIGADRPDVWIERYQRIECEHRFGPQFALDAADHLALEQAAQRIAASTELAVVGLYRSHTRPGFQLEDSDLELIGRYFSDPSDLVLLIRPENMDEISAQFFARDAAGGMRPVGEPFPFRGRVLGLAEPIPAEDEDPAEVTRQTEPGRRETKREVRFETAAITANEETPALKGENGDSGSWQPHPAAESPAPPRQRMRRLVPDFAPAAEPVEPGGVFSFEPRPAAAPRDFMAEPEPSSLRRLAGRWWPLAGAIALVAGAMWILLGQGRHAAAPDSAAAAAAEYRPVGMYVDPGAQRWRVSWNPAATAFHNARSVALFVHDGDAEDRVDLTKQDVEQGTYSWQPKGNDVTFRLEAIDGSGRISAESFRVVRTPPANSAPPSNASVAAPAPGSAAPAPDARITPAKAIHKVPPVVPASIRPRIRGVIPIDVRVHIDARGRVISAAPARKENSGLEAYLASRAVYAAKLWRFTPARENGRPVASTQTIHFVFEK